MSDPHSQQHAQDSSRPFRPIYGNFRRYYHIRKSKNTSTRKSKDNSVGNNKDDIREALADHPRALDPRLHALLAWLKDPEAKQSLAENRDGGDQGGIALETRSMTVPDIERVLDIGCNSGKVTLEVAQTLRPSPALVLGVDIDGELIRQAKNRARHAWSRYRPRVFTLPVEEGSRESFKAGKGKGKEKPSAGEDSEQSAFISYASVSHLLEPDALYFPSCFSTLIGALPYPPRHLLGRNAHPTPPRASPAPDIASKRKRKVQSEVQGSSGEEGPGSPPGIAKRKRRKGSYISADIDAASVLVSGSAPECQDDASSRAQVQAPSKSQPDLFPSNLFFQEAEWVNAAGSTSAARDTAGLTRLREEDEKGYDLILGFSITKWIHIHLGDGGLRLFFARIANALRPGGIFVLERQDWKSYDQARSLGADLRAKYSQLKLRPVEFDYILCHELHLRGPVRIAQVQGSGFVRALDIFVQPMPSSSSSDSALIARRKALLDLEAAAQVPWVPVNPRLREVRTGDGDDEGGEEVEHIR